MKSFTVSFHFERMGMFWNNIERKRPWQGVWYVTAHLYCCMFFLFFVFFLITESKYAKIQGDTLKHTDKTIQWVICFRTPPGPVFYYKQVERFNKGKIIPKMLEIQPQNTSERNLRWHWTKSNLCLLLHLSVILLIIRNPKEHNWHKGDAICVAMWETGFDTGPDFSPQATRHTQQSLRDY